jgi:hypothetical protein
MSTGQAKYGPQTSRGRVSIIHANVTNGAICFSPVLPGEREEDWLAVLSGVRERIQPADRLEKEMSYHLALSFWQALRLHKYERAATHKQLEDVAKEQGIFSDGDAMAQLLERGVESVKADLGVMEKALGLIGAAGFTDDDESLSKDDGELVLQLAARLVLKGKSVEQAFSGLPEDGWTWSVVRENLSELCEAVGKSLPWLLKELHADVMEKLSGLRKTLEEGVRSIEANYALKDGETEIEPPVRRFGIAPLVTILSPAKRTSRASAKAETSLPTVIRRRRNSIDCANAGNTIFVSLFKNRQLLFLAETPWPAPPGLLSETQLMQLPIVIGPGMDPVGGANAGNTVLGGLLKNRQLLFLAETLCPPGEVGETQLMPPSVVGEGTNVVSSAGPGDTVPGDLFQNLELLP